LSSVRLEGVTKKYGEIVAVRNVSLEVGEKEYFCIIGPSGCGKTTLLKLIAGIIEPTTGRIYINDKLVNHVPPEERGVGFVFQNIALFPHLNVLENACYSPWVKGEREPERFSKRFLEAVGYKGAFEAMPGELSLGDKQRVAIARALSSGASLLLLDEPLSALDAADNFRLRFELRELIRKLGVTAIHITHDQGEAMSLADRIGVMKAGRILQVGTPYEIYNNPRTPFVMNFVGEASFLTGRAVSVRDGWVEVEGRNGVKLWGRGECRVGDLVCIGYRPENIEITRDGNVKAELLSVSYRGGYFRCVLLLESGEKVVAVTEENLALKPGEKVGVSFSEGIVFKYPEKGLTEELAIE